MKYAKKSENGWRVEEVLGSGSVADAQVLVLKASGYMPVREQKKPADTPYTIWSDSYALDGDEVAQTWFSSSVIIPLDKAKLIAAIDALGLLDDAIAYFGEDADAKNWWANNMTYVEGSSMAAKVMQALGLTLEQVHAIVEQCRA